MALIALLVALVGERFVTRFQEARELAWFPGYADAVVNRVPARLGAWGRLLLVLAGPVGLVWLAQALAADWAWGLAELVLAVAVLFLTLRLGGLEERVDAYLAAHEAGHIQEARHHAQAIIDAPIPQDAESEAGEVAAAVLRQGMGRVFGVIFWFAVLGPLGAVAYRLSVELSRGPGSTASALGPALVPLRGFLDWAPARLMALGFVLTGNFEQGLQAWRSPAAEHGTDLAAENHALLARVGCGALTLTPDEAEQAGFPASGGAGMVRSARGLVLRSLVIWLAVVALMTLGGWLD